MAELFNSNIVQAVIDKLASTTLQEISLAWNVNEDLVKLRETLSTIKAVLLDAEEKQGKNTEITLWLSKLKDAFYDAEDIIDEFEYKFLHKQSNIGRVRRFFSISSNPFAFRINMGHKLKEIRERFDDIANQKDKYHLSERSVDERIMCRRNETTHSFVHSCDVIGRDTDRDVIIERLLNHREEERLSVVPVVGIGGVGKTTLAKLVYNDARVVRNFQLKIWICVSVDFDVTRLVKQITTSAKGKIFDGFTIDLLLKELQKILDGSKFLLVLDDVWNENRAKWLELRSLLENGAVGSKIIVTTRSSTVALIVGNDLAHNLCGLPHSNCLSIFLKWAFSAGQEKQYPKLVHIANDIVRKCGGVPLAVRTLGSLLYASTDEKQWLSIRDNEIWMLQHDENDILPVLKLSFYHMPSHLKRCFAYCSLFPKGQELDSFQLVQFWMAYSLIGSPDKGQCLEDRGLQYFKELWSRSFFHDVEDHGFFFTCKMHDLVHDLAASVAQSECSTLNFLTEDVYGKARHLSFSGDNIPGEEVPNFFDKLDRVRTIWFPIYGMGPSNESFINTSILRFRQLRVLNLSDSCIEVLPNSIGNLKHLRYLDLIRNRKIRRLPKSFCKLQHLQTLRLEECENLEEIPRDIKQLFNLRSLEITTKQVVLPENGIGCLRSLRYLSLFECRNLEHMFEDMQSLTCLRTLVIASCGSLTSLPRGMKYLTSLETLTIADCGRLNLMEMENSLSLTSLILGDLPQLDTLPRWIQGCTSTLQYLYIYKCGNLKAWPEWFQYLTSLQRMEILHCSELMSLPGQMISLSALRVLMIRGCPELQRRCAPEIGEDWFKIAHVADVYLNGIKVNQC